MSTLPLLMTLADELDNIIPTLSRSQFYADDYSRCCGAHAGMLHNRQLPAHHMRQSGRAHHGFGDRHYRHGGHAAMPLTVGKDGFQVCMDVQQFKPSELTVKVVDDSVEVEGKHEEREDEHGYITRHFRRRYVLPRGYNADHVVSTLSSDGVLTVKVPTPGKSDKNERVIQIQQTGPAHLNVSDNKQHPPSSAKMNGTANGSKDTEHHNGHHNGHLNGHHDEDN